MKIRAFIIDLLLVLLFVAIGRNTHEDGFSLSGMTSTTWPFAVGLVAGWLVIVLTHRDATTKSSGTIIAIWTVTMGMILRVISGQGTALSFVIVALVFLSLFFVGWRTLLSLRRNGRRTVR